MEGYRRNKFYLSKLIKENSFFLIFIQEHWMSSFEADTKFSSDFTEYEFLTTCNDSFLSPEEIILQQGPVWHGTALGWYSSISSNITKFPVISTRFCGVKIKYSDLAIIAYTAYLPTSGQDDLFIEVLDLLDHDITEHNEKDSIIIIGADANTSEKSSARRQEAFSSFNEKFMVGTLLPGSEPTFHHNNGSSESQIDHILTNNCDAVSFLRHICKYEDPVNLSSHDAILGQLEINSNTCDNTDESEIIYDEFTTVKIHWEPNEYQPSGEGGARYPPATPHRLQNPKWPPGGPKMAEGVWKGVYP